MAAPRSRQLPLWPLALAAARSHFRGTLPAHAAVDALLYAAAATLVDSKLKTAKVTTGQMLVTFEQALRHMVKSAQQRGAAAGAPLHSALLPSWPPLRQAGAADAFAALLCHLEQRLFLAHTGAPLCSRHGGLLAVQSCVLSHTWVRHGHAPGTQWAVCAVAAFWLHAVRARGLLAGGLSKPCHAMQRCHPQPP